jgi:rod shape-determining protein MreB
MITFKSPIVYIQLSPERITLRNARTGLSISEVQEVALASQPSTRIVGIGSEARAHQSDPAVKVVNPFAHPRSIVSDFSVGEQLVKLLLRRMLGRSIFSLSPRIVMHPLGEYEGGYTQIEIRALRELALGAGARQVVVWEGRELSELELLAWEFKSGGKVLS